MTRPAAPRCSVGAAAGDGEVGAGLLMAAEALDRVLAVKVDAVRPYKPQIDTMAYRRPID